MRHETALKFTILVGAFLVWISPVLQATAGEAEIHLKEGPGRAQVVGACIVCHSLDYIQMNSPFLDHKGWAAVVQKMIHSYGAPVTDANEKIIIDYLSTQYGKAEKK